MLALVAAGATNREIGERLHMAEKTASVHVSRILAKLNVCSRTEAAAVAHRQGLVPTAELRPRRGSLTPEAPRAGPTRSPPVNAALGTLATSRTNQMMRALVTGATGFVGGRLASALAARGAEVRCLVRDRGRAAPLAQAGHELHEGDVLDAESLRGAGEGVSTAYYLVHSMGRGGDRGASPARERRAAENFARMASDEGVERVVYLGGLGDERSEHLKSRAATAATLAEHGPPLTYLRAAMVVGAGSESYRTVRYLVGGSPR